MGDRVRIEGEAEVVELALREMEDRIFWEEAHAAFARLASDPKESAEFYSEFEAWDRGTALRDEQQEC